MNLSVELHITNTMSSPKTLFCALLEAWSMLGGMLEAEWTEVEKQTPYSYICFSSRNSSALFCVLSL